jgi:adenosine deaminase
VPLALATHDEGIARCELTWYFKPAVVGYQADHRTLKRMVRDSLDHAFVPGASLWAAPEDFTIAPSCANRRLQSEPSSASCRELLAGSERARLEWKEEMEFASFEAQF